MLKGLHKMDKPFEDSHGAVHAVFEHLRCRDQVMVTLQTVYARHGRLITKTG